VEFVIRPFEFYNSTIGTTNVLTGGYNGYQCGCNTVQGCGCPPNQES